MAFCFYNLSSIVNGLVYFDQVSLLPTSHILLVTVGIFILLGGVWAVSLQAVNVGTWSGGDDVDVTLIEDGVADESSVPECDPSLASPALQTPEHDHARSHAESATSPLPPSPLSSRLFSPYHRHRQSSLGGTMPLSSPTNPVPSPVFSIGLSPASPGFVLIPRERRRCVSGQSGGDRWDEVIRHVRARRIVSDTGVMSVDEVERSREEDGAGENGTSQAAVRWSWLRSLVLGEGGRSGS